MDEANDLIDTAVDDTDATKDDRDGNGKFWQWFCRL
jgi:hypothetical protein